jgi:hypothetical protein
MSGSLRFGIRRIINHIFAIIACPSYSCTFAIGIVIQRISGGRSANRFTPTPNSSARARRPLPSFHSSRDHNNPPTTASSFFSAANNPHSYRSPAPHSHPRALTDAQSNPDSYPVRQARCSRSRVSHAPSRTPVLALLGGAYRII